MKGAEQGVAITAANIPVVKSPPHPPLPPIFAMPVIAPCPIFTANRPSILAANSTTNAIISARNVGFWNCMPQPTVTPAARSAITTPARPRKNTNTPAADARKPPRTRPTDLSRACSALASLSDSTGRTQGIMFRISPPSSAISNTPQIADPTAGGVGATGDSVAAIVAARRPSTKVRSRVPSPGFRTGSVANMVRPPSARTISGRSNAA